MSCQVKHWIYMKENVNPVNVEPKVIKVVKVVKVIPWFRWFFIKIEKPVEVWEEAFPWP